MFMSLLAQECGLKLPEHYPLIGRCLQVTPCTGVWIEIEFDLISHFKFHVTPCTGVWIEIRC